MTVSAMNSALKIDFRTSAWDDTSGSNDRLCCNSFNASEKHTRSAAETRKMSLNLEQGEPANGKDVCMARKKKRRSYGTGCVLTKPSGLAIRWRESVRMPDGTVGRQLRYEMLGPVSLREATQALRDRQAESQILKRAPMSFEEFAKSWEQTVLPMHKHSTR